MENLISIHLFVLIIVGIGKTLNDALNNLGLPWNCEVTK